MVAVVIVLAAVIALVLMEKKPGQKNRVQQSYERTMSSQPGEWAKYYNKK
jgi:tagatose-1,6-bisphosphate aldolase non-catalytic subunit AgaZ/GatZ